MYLLFVLFCVGKVRVGSRNHTSPISRREGEGKSKSTTKNEDKKLKILHGKPKCYAAIHYEEVLSLH